MYHSLIRLWYNHVKIHNIIIHLHVYYVIVQDPHYAILAVPASAGKTPERDPLKVEYSVIDPKSQVARTDKNSMKQSTPAEQGD